MMPVANLSRRSERSVRDAQITQNMSEAVKIRMVTPEEVKELIPLLLLAEPSESALHWSLEHLSDAVYRLEVGRALVGAATVRWEREPCEIVELAVAAERQGQGIGRALVAWLLAEAEGRGKAAMIVGTRNSSWATSPSTRSAGSA